jgi:hypothetical protein
MISCPGQRVRALPVSGQVTSRLEDAVVAVRRRGGEVQLQAALSVADQEGSVNQLAAQALK